MSSSRNKYAELVDNGKIIPNKPTRKKLSSDLIKLIKELNVEKR